MKIILVVSMIVVFLVFNHLSLNITERIDNYIKKMK